MFLAVGTLILLFFVLPKISQTDKTLQVGSQVGEDVYQFTYEIKDKEKIIEYEKWFDNIDFSEETEEEFRDDYADIIVQIRNYKEGISTHPVSIWIDGNDITVISQIDTGNSISKISKNDLDDLQAIID